MKLRRFLFLLWAGLLVAAAACAQPVSTLYDKTEYRIAMRDSVRLHTSVFTPKAPGKAPIIIFRTPYGTGPYGEGQFPGSFEKGYMRSYVDRGYIIVQQDVRFVLRLLVSGGGRGLDVDRPARQLGRQPGVLARPANGRAFLRGPCFHPVWGN